MGVRLQRIGDEHLAGLAIVTAQDDKMPGRLTANVVLRVLRTVLAHRMIEVGGTEAGDDRAVLIEVTPDEGSPEGFKANLAAQPEEVDVRTGDELELGGTLGLRLRGQLFDQVHLLFSEPRRIKDEQVVRVHRDTETPTQRIASQHDAQRSTRLEPGHLADKILQRHLVPQVTVHRMQARGAAGRVVGLRTHLQFELVLAGTTVGRHRGSMREPPSRCQEDTEGG